MDELTFGFVKPDGYKNRSEIREMISRSGLEIIAEQKRVIITEDVAKKHYETLLGKPYYDRAVRSIIGQTSHFLLYGDNAIQRLKDLSGPTDPKLASQKTIRGRYGLEIPQDLTKPVKNAFHRADSKHDVAREILIHFPRNKIPDTALNFLQEYSEELEKD